MARFGLGKYGVLTGQSAKSVYLCGSCRADHPFFIKVVNSWAIYAENMRKNAVLIKKVSENAEKTLLYVVLR